jgi:hypothetical protein
MSVSEFWLTFVSDVVGEGFFSRADIALARTCADLMAVVEDDPDSFSLSTLSEIKSGTLAPTRHSCLIRSILANVV